MAPLEKNPFDTFAKALMGTENTVEPMPDTAVMIGTAMDILAKCESGKRLVGFARDQKFEVKVIRSRTETTYIPMHSKEVYIGVTTNTPTLPARFVLMLAGALKEAQQDTGGMKRPTLNQPLSEIIRLSTLKESDKVANMCLVGYELDQTPELSKYKFLDEMRRMGYSETVDTFLKNL